MQNKIIENLEKIEVIVAANFAHEHPEVVREVRSLAQEAMREVRSLLTQRAVDVARRCPACNTMLEETSVYCDNCGTDTPRN